MTVPVAILLYNRPALAARLLRALAVARPPRLYVIADGARAGDAADAVRVAAVRRAVDELVTWPCDVKRDFAPANLGLKSRVKSGLDWVFSREDQAVILEDDCIPVPAFFPYCETALARFREDPRIGMVTGWSFIDSRPPAPPVTAGTFGRAGGPALPTGTSADRTDVYLSRWPHIWGWATWRDRWADYDDGFRAWREEADEGRRLPWMNPEMRRRWNEAFAKAQSGEIDTWDYQWMALHFARGWACLTPRWSLVENIGLGDEATHTKRQSWLHRRPRDVVPRLAEIFDPAESDRLSREVWETAINVGRRKRFLHRLRSLFRAPPGPGGRSP